jgi:hypothetical protein
MTNYPPLELSAVQALGQLKELSDADPKWLDNAPYDAEIKALLQAVFTKQLETVVLKDNGAKDNQTVGRKRKDGGMSDAQAEVIEVEAGALLKELKDLKPPTGKGFDHDTKIQIIKAKTALIEKVVNIQERAFNVRKVANFQKIVIDILADLVDGDKISEFQTRLGAYL